MVRACGRCARCAPSWRNSNSSPMRGCGSWWRTSLAQPLSVGTLVNLVRQGAERLQGVEREIKAALRDAPGLHHDETGLRVVGAEGARLEWTHVTATPSLTDYAR